ncbi:MAG: PAS domain S-box protein [Alphaproteobacteria bacterium]
MTKGDVSYRTSSWSEEFADPNMERQFWLESWSDWSKITRYAALFAAVLLLAITAVQSDLPTLASNKYHMVVTTTRVVAILLFAMVIFLTLLSPPRYKILQAAVAAAMLGIALSVHVSQVIYDRDFGVFLINHISLLIFIHLVVPNRAAYRLFNGMAMFIAFVIASHYVVSSSNKSLLTLALLGVGMNIFGFAASRWRAGKLRVDFRHRRTTEQERTLALDNLRASESEVRTILENLVDTFYRTDTEGRIMMISPSITDLVEFHPDELIGQRLADYYVDPNVRDDFLRQLAEGDGRVNGYEAQLFTKDGGKVWVSTSARYRRDDDGNIAGVEGIVRNITERKQAEEALRESESRFRDFAKTGTDWLWEMDNELRFTYLSPNFERAVGVPAKWHYGKTWEDILGGDYDRETWKNHLQDLALRKRFRDFTYLRIGEGIESKWFCTSGRPIFGADGEFLGYRGTESDVTERKRAEEALRESEERFRDFAETASDWVWEMDADLRFTRLPDTYEETTGRPAEAALGRTRQDVHAEIIASGTPEEQEQWRQHFADLEARRPFKDFVQPWITADGETLFFADNGKPYFDESGDFAGYRGTVSNITDRVLAERALEKSEARSRAIFDQAAVGIGLMTPGGRFLAVNQKLCDLLDIGAEELVSLRFENITHPDDYAACLVQTARLLSGEIRSFAIEIRYSPKENFTLWGKLTTSIIRDPDSERITRLGIVEDVTEARYLNDQLRQAHKMEAVGQLTGGIAHDFNNILGAVIGNLSLLENSEGIGEEFERKCIAIALRASLRGAELTHRLLAFSRQQDLFAKTTQINEILPNFCQLAQRTIGEDIAIEMKLATDLWPTMVDTGELENALLNLAINARDAMPDGGQLTIETANWVLDEDYAASVDDLASGEYVTVTVGDDGAGMPAAVCERVFEPFSRPRMSVRAVAWA